MRIGLISSLVLNCALVVATMYLGQRVGIFDMLQAANQQASSAAVDKSEPRSSVQALGTWDLQQLRHLHAGLLKAGLDEMDAKGVLVALMYASIERPPQEYWKPRHTRLADEFTADHRTGVAMYAALKELFGNEADAASSILRRFLPLQHEFAFLPAEKQLRVQEVLIAHRPAERISAVPSRGAMAQRRASLLGELREVLTKDELFEYELRRSPIAERLRETGFDFTEAEFRKVFAVLLSADHSTMLGPTPTPATWSGPALPPQAQRIAKVLGDERFRQYVKFQDPTYQVLDKTSSAFGLAPTTADAAYEIIQRTAEKANNVGANKPVLSIATRAQIAELILARDRELRRLLGETAFSFVRTSIATDELTLSSGARVPNAAVVNKEFQ